MTDKRVRRRRGSDDGVIDWVAVAANVMITGIAIFLDALSGEMLSRRKTPMRKGRSKR